MKSNFEKDKAIYTQKLEFLEIQLKEAKEKQKISKVDKIFEKAFEIKKNDSNSELKKLEEHNQKLIQKLTFYEERFNDKFLRSLDETLIENQKLKHYLKEINSEKNEIKNVLTEKSLNELKNLYDQEKQLLLKKNEKLRNKNKEIIEEYEKKLKESKKTNSHQKSLSSQNFQNILFKNENEESSPFSNKLKPELKNKENQNKILFVNNNNSNEGKKLI